MPLLYLEPLPPRTAKGDVLRLICSAGGIRRELVGRIEVHGAIAAVEVPAGSESRLARALEGAELNGRRLRARPGGTDRVEAPDDHFGRLARLVQLESEE